MFGLFSRNKREKKELADLEARGAAQSSDPLIRLRHVKLVHQLQGSDAALPYYNAIARNFPAMKRAAFNAATLRLVSGDAEAVAPLEAVAAARPSLAVSAYGMLSRYFQEVGDGEEARRTQALFEAAIEKREAALAEERFEDPGGPLEQPAYSEEQAAYLYDGLRGVRGLEQLFAASRKLDDGAVQHVLLMVPDDGAELSKVAGRIAELADLFGEFVLYPIDPKVGWILNRMIDVGNCRIYP